MVSLDRILKQRRSRTKPRARALSASRRPTGGALDRLARLRRQARVTPERVPATVPIRGFNVSTRGGTRQPEPRDKELTAEELAALLAGLGDGGEGGGLSAADRQAEIRLESRLGAEESARRRTFERQEALRERAARAEEMRQQLEERRQSDIRGLRGERQSRFVDLIGRDQARAVLFALGLGPQADIFTARASQLESTLPALKGARTLELETEAALAQLLGKDIDIGAQGVSGIGPAQGAATAFQRGGLSAQQLLASAFGVGDLGTGRQPGIGADELLRIVQSVTPVGNL